MRVTATLLSLLLLPVVTGCEGNTPRRSPLAVSSSPSAAKPVVYAPPSKSPVAVAPAGQGNAGNPDPQPVVVNPANNAPITIDGDKLETRRQLHMYHTAIFLRKEVGALAATGIQENNNFVFRPAQGFVQNQLISLMDAYRATNGKPPQTVKEFLKMLENNNEGISLPELQPNEFYIYDPENAAVKKEEIDYLLQYP